MGYTPVQSAGILGNLKAESNLNTGSIGDKGTSYGLAQWHNERWNALNDFAKNQGLAPSDPEAQLRYLDWELKNKEPTAFKALQSAQTPEQAAQAFIHFERPQGYNAANPMAAMGANARVQNALDLYNSISGGKPVPGIMGAAASTAAPAVPPVLDQASQDADLDALTQQQAAPDMRGLLAQMMPQQQQQQAEQTPLPTLDLEPPGGGRGLAFQQIKLNLKKRRT